MRSTVVTHIVTRASGYSGIVGRADSSLLYQPQYDQDLGSKIFRLARDLLPLCACSHFSRPDQTDRQVVASERKLNLRRDLRWVAKWTGKFPRKYTPVAKKGI